MSLEQRKGETSPLTSCGAGSSTNKCLARRMYLQGGLGRVNLACLNRDSLTNSGTQVTGNSKITATDQASLAKALGHC